MADPGGRGTRTFIKQKFPLTDTEGEIYGLCGILTDISERKEREVELLTKVEWSSRIREAIASDQLTLHAQPIVDLKTGELVQEELLVRMQGKDGELIMPGDFLPQAERYGLAPEIDRWVVSKAAVMARDRRVEVNLSAKSIGDPTLPGFIELELAAVGADPANVVFEITETAAAEDFDQARALADRLTRLGCGFALDDFGTGFGSFTYLKHLQVSYIKIDVRLRPRAHRRPRRPAGRERDRRRRTQLRHRDDRRGRRISRDAGAAHRDGRRLRPGLPHRPARHRPR